MYTGINSLFFNLNQLYLRFIRGTHFLLIHIRATLSYLFVQRPAHSFLFRFFFFLLVYLSLALRRFFLLFAPDRPEETERESFPLSLSPFPLLLSCNSIATIFCVAGSLFSRCTRIPSHLLSFRPTFYLLLLWVQRAK